MSRAVRSLVAITFVAAALPALAFTRETTSPGHPGSGLCLWWNARAITFQVNATAATHTPCEDPALAEGAVAAGLAAWSGATPSSCTDFHFANGGATTKINIGRDGTNLVVFRTGRCQAVAGTDPCMNTWGACGSKYNCWDVQYGDQTIGMTTTTFDTGTGEILDADMELNGWDGVNPPPGNPPNAQSHYFTCGDPGLPLCANVGDTNCTRVDVAAVATHEGGHMLGLDHVCGSAPYDACPSPGAIMSPQVGSAAQRAALTVDDVNGICTIYPKNAATLTCAPPEQHKGGGCSSAGGGGLAGLLAAAAIAALRQRRRTGA